MDIRKFKLICFHQEDIRLVSLPNGISLSLVDSHLKKQKQFDLNVIPEQIEFCFFKQAHLEFSFLDDNSDLIAAPMTSHLVMNKKRKGKVIYFTDSPCQWLSIRMSVNDFENMFCFSKKINSTNQMIEFLKSENFFCHNSSMTSQMKAAFNELFLCPFYKDEHLFYAQAKCMELIALKLMQVHAPFVHPHPKGHTREEIIAGRAASILMANMANPLRSEELAKQVGVSISRLKQIFPKVYGVSPFGFLRRQRLEYAKDLILHSGFNASEAAFKVGYSELSPFHRAFVKEFGLTPGQFRSRSMY